MKKAFLSLLLVSGIIFIQCGENDIQLPDQVLQGQVDGNEWEMKFANAYLFSTDLKYQIRFLSTQENAVDPCTVPSTANTHVSMIFQLRRGSFSVPFPLINDSPRFHFADGSTAIATSGFLEVFEIVNGRIFGYLQAQLDDENIVEGSFDAVICN